MKTDREIIADLEHEVAQLRQVIASMSDAAESYESEIDSLRAKSSVVESNPEGHRLIVELATWQARATGFVHMPHNMLRVQLDVLGVEGPLNVLLPKETVVRIRGSHPGYALSQVPLWLSLQGPR